MVHPLLSRQFANFTVYTFDHFEHPVLGVGRHRRPFVDLEPFLDLTQADAMHQEAMTGIFKASNVTLPGVLGQTPPEFRERYGFRDFEASMLYHIEDYDSHGTHRRQLEALPRLEDRRRYLFHVMGCVQPWAFTLYLRRANFSNKTARHSAFPEWEEDAEHFPLLREWVKTLPFKEIGRVMFFCTDPGQEVPAHRDQIVATHSDHCINVWFDGARPAYLWDCTTKRQIILPPTRAYFFNNRDYHGVLPDQHFRYTLRIDGTFTDELADALGMTFGHVCEVGSN